MADESTKINTTLKANDTLKEGITILAKEEWFKLQAFCDAAVSNNPTTEAEMRSKLKLAADAKLNPDFEETLKHYVDLKGYCTTFQTEIKPGTVDLANDIVQYARRADVIYGRLMGLLSDYTVDGKVNDIKLQALVKEWGSGNPSDKSVAIQKQFQSYIDRLKTEADERSSKAGALKTKLTTFRDNLKTSESDFSKNYEDYQKKYGEAEKELNALRGEISDLENELARARKKESDETIVLATAPAYLIIPVIGPFVMAGVLIGVGVDFGLLREKLKEKIKEAETKKATAGTKATFFLVYTEARNCTKETAEAIKAVLPLVEKLKIAWDALSSDLGDLSKVMGSAQGLALKEDWDFASIDLGTAQKTWLDLKEQADQYRRFADCERVDNVDQLTEAMKKAA
jgi:hypothetical protein